MQKTKRMIKSKLGKKVRTFKDMKNDRQEIEKLMKELNENSRMRTKRSQKTAKTRYLKEGQKSTKYFFNLNKDRHDPQVISELLNKSGKCKGIVRRLRQNMLELIVRELSQVEAMCSPGASTNIEVSILLHCHYLYTKLAGPCTSRYGHVHLDISNYTSRYSHTVLL